MGVSPLWRLLALLHRHDWQEKVNRWGWCFERKCRKCGAVQHNVWKDFISWRDLSPKWRDGPHP